MKDREAPETCDCSPGPRRVRPSGGVLPASWLVDVTVSVAICVLLTCRPAPVVAQSEVDRGTESSIDGASPGWGGVFGAPFSRPHVIVGAWALHPFEPQFPELDWSAGFGVKSHQWLFATFVNSYDRRSFIAALERYWWVGDFGDLSVGVGYRAGVITGYDEELIALAGKTPLMPFTGLLLWTDLGPFSIDAFYAYRGITLETGLAFR